MQGLKKCVFVEYASNQKGYKCFNASDRKFFVSMMLSFFENKSFFEKHFQGKSQREDVGIFGIILISTFLINPWVYRIGKILF